MQAWKRVDAPYMSEDPDLIELNSNQLKSEEKRAAQANNKAPTMLLKHTTEHTVAESVPKRGMKVLRYSEVLQRRRA